MSTNPTQLEEFSDELRTWHFRSSRRARDFKIETSGKRRNVVIAVTHLPTQHTGLYLVPTWFGFEVEFHTTRQGIIERFHPLQRLSDRILGPRRWWPVNGNDITDIFTRETASQLTTSHLAAIGTGPNFNEETARAIAADLARVLEVTAQPAERGETP